MARQNRTQSTDTTTTEEVAVSDTTTAPETAPESTEVTAPVESTEVAIDLTEFEAAVSAAIETRDSTTGVVPDAEVAKVTAVYQGLDGIKPKNAAKARVEELMLGAVDKLEIQQARAYNDVKKGLKAGTTTSSTPKAPADPKAAYVQRLTALRLASTLVEVPEGVDADAASTEADEALTGLAAEVEAYRAFLALPEPAEGETAPEAPATSAVVKQAFKLSAGKAPGGTRGGSVSGAPRGDIAKHVAEAFADKAQGDEMKVSEIANFKSSVYPEGNASQGAISIRLFPTGDGKCSIEGIVPVDRDSNGPRRARKA